MEKEQKKSKVKAPPKPKKDDFAKGFSEAWAGCFSSNKSLMHVDLSNNSLAVEDVEIIADGLKNNQ
jgi:hypothetical protein